MKEKKRVPGIRIAGLLCCMSLFPFFAQGKPLHITAPHTQAMYQAQSWENGGEGLTEGWVCGTDALTVAASVIHRLKTAAHAIREGREAVVRAHNDAQMAASRVQETFSGFSSAQVDVLLEGAMLKNGRSFQECLGDLYQIDQQWGEQFTRGEDIWDIRPDPRRYTLSEGGGHHREGMRFTRQKEGARLVWELLDCFTVEEMQKMQTAMKTAWEEALRERDAWEKDIRRIVRHHAGTAPKTGE